MTEGKNTITEESAKCCPYCGSDYVETEEKEIHIQLTHKNGFVSSRDNVMRIRCMYCSNCFWMYSR